MLVGWVLFLVVAAACGQAGWDGDGSPAPAELPAIVYRSPTCGCCAEYEEYLRANGFDIESVVTDDADGIKEEYGVPEEMESCHTTVIGEYFVEGHVPAEAIVRLLEEKPAIDGIALPGMPAGSPGMGGVKSEPFTIYAVTNGQVSEFMRI